MSTSQPTGNTDPVYLFDEQAQPVPLGTPASPRPVGRPRRILPEGETQIAIFEEEAAPAPPGTPASPRPVGRERWRSIPVADRAPELVVGDVVRLRSGGPTMTIVGPSETMLAGQPTGPTGLLWCAWFNNGDYRRELLPREALIRASS